MCDKEKWVQTFDTCLYETMSEGKKWEPEPFRTTKQAEQIGEWSW